MLIVFKPLLGDIPYLFIDKRWLKDRIPKTRRPGHDQFTLLNQGNRLREMTVMPKIYFIDVTNRDGVQTAKLGLSKLKKTMVNLYLNEMGVFQSEFGFPITKHETNYLNANLELAKMGVLKPIRLEG